MGGGAIVDDTVLYNDPEGLIRERKMFGRRWEAGVRLALSIARVERVTVVVLLRLLFPETAVQEDRPSVRLSDTDDCCGYK